MGDVLRLLPQLVSVFAIAFISFWAAIPAGLALGLGPIPVVITTVLSYASGVGVVVLVGKPLRDWLMRRFGKKIKTDGDSLIQRAWKRFGVIGLALLAPMTVGAQTGALVGLTLGVPPRRLLIAMSLGAMAWAIVLTGAVLLGVLGARSLS